MKKNKEVLPPKPGYTLVDGKYRFGYDGWGPKPSEEFLSNKKLELHLKIFRLLINHGTLTNEQIGEKVGMTDYKKLAVHVRHIKREKNGAYDIRCIKSKKGTAKNKYILKRLYTGKPAFIESFRRAFHTQIYIDLKPVDPNTLRCMYIAADERAKKYKRKYLKLKRLMGE
jgi:hypothetical protein